MTALSLAPPLASGASTLPRRSTPDLVALILPWAKATHPEKYEQTLRVARNEPVFRRYLLRLVELRWAAEPEWRGTVPLSVLDETALVAHFRRADGSVLEVKGRAAPPPIVTRWWELGLAPADFAALQAAKAILDLEHPTDDR